MTIGDIIKACKISVWELREDPTWGHRHRCEDCIKINNNIYLLQLGCNPVAVVMLHVYKTWNWLLL